MANPKARYSRLAPLSLEDRIRISVAALRFFAPMLHKEMCAVLGRAPQEKITPFSGRDFSNYLKRAELLEEPDRYVHRVRDLLTQLERAGLLTDMGHRPDFFWGGHYYALFELTEREKKGTCWLARALGPEFVHHIYSTITMQVTGTDAHGDSVAGTALLLEPNKLLTCAHVIKDIVLDDQQVFNGQQVHIVRTAAHPRVDVGLIEVAPPMTPLPGLAFRDPVVGEGVFTLGYPRIPLSHRPALVMQSGEVTTPTVDLLDGRAVFLFSATARPGNSGGPVLSETGHVLGIVTDELLDRGGNFAMPFHAGLRTTEIAEALAEMDSSVALPVESYE